ncbi:hypothetical protein PG989_016150 [Apiospora arundinis]
MLVPTSMAAWSYEDRPNQWGELGLGLLPSASREALSRQGWELAGGSARQYEKTSIKILLE